MSGTAADLLLLVTASARSLPARTNSITDGMVANMKCTCSPESRSFKATAPLYGTCVAWTPAMVLSSSPERCDEVPVPVDEKKYFPGFALSSATNSANDWTGIALGLTTSMLGTCTTSDIGVKSFKLS